MSQRIAVIQGHPDAAGGHYCHALAEAYAEAAQDGGHEVRRIEVARLEFPLLANKQAFEQQMPCADIRVAQETVLWANHIVIVYPLWLGMLPASLKAFLEQLLRPGFAHRITEKGRPEKLLKGRSARIVVTMGMPAFFYRWYFGAHSLKALKRSILAFCGIAPIHSTLIGGVEAPAPEGRKRWLAWMAELGRTAR